MPTAPPGQEPWAGSPVVPMYQPPKFVKLVGLLLGLTVFVGLAAFDTAIMLPVPGSSLPSNPDQAAYVLTVRALTAVFLAAMDVAVGISVTFAWAWGMGRPDLTEGARRGLFLFASVFLGIWLLFTTFASVFLSFLRFFP